MQVQTYYHKNDIVEDLIIQSKNLLCIKTYYVWKQVIYKYVYIMILYVHIYTKKRQEGQTPTSQLMFLSLVN